MASFQKIITQTICTSFFRKITLQLTLERFSTKNTESVFCDKNFKLAPRVLCVGSVDHEHMLYDIAEKSEVELDLLLEPCQKNTCAAIVASSIF